MALNRSTKYHGLTLDSPDDTDWYQFTLGANATSGEFRVESQSSLDEIEVTVYQVVNGALTRIPNASLLPVSVVTPDLAEQGSGNNSPANAFHLGALDLLALVTGLSIDRSADEDWFSFDLNDSPAILVDSADAPVNGVLSGAATFKLKLGNAGPVDVTVQPDASNTSLGDLVDDLNNALDGAGLGASVVAGREGNRITLALRDPLSQAALTLSAPNDETIAKLHFSDGQHASAKPRGTLTLALAEEFVNAGVTLRLNLYSSIGGALLATAQTAGANGSVTLDLTGRSSGKYWIRVSVDPATVQFKPVRYDLVPVLGATAANLLDLSGSGNNRYALSNLAAGES